MKVQRLIHATRGQEWVAEREDKPWTHMEVEYAQGPDTFHLYPTNIGVVGYGSEVREGIVWQ